MHTKLPSHLFFSLESLNNPRLNGSSHVIQFPKYCKTTVEAVERLGVYSLFLPEIIPATVFKKVIQ